MQPMAAYYYNDTSIRPEGLIKHKIVLEQIWDTRILRTLVDPMYKTSIVISCQTTM